MHDHRAGTRNDDPDGLYGRIAHGSLHGYRQGLRGTERERQGRLRLRRLTDPPHPDRAGRECGHLRLREHEAHEGAPERRVHGQQHRGSVPREQPGPDRPGGKPGRDHRCCRPEQTGCKTRHRHQRRSLRRLHPADARQDGRRSGLRPGLQGRRDG